MSLNDKASNLNCVRPVTAVSLPTKVQTEEMNNNKISNNKLVFGGAKYKNPSCPAIEKNYSNDYDYENDNAGDIRKITIKNRQQKINKYEKCNPEQDPCEEDLARLNENPKTYSVLTDSSNSLNINVPIKIIGATEVANSNATLNSQNSKMDTLLGFTTVTLFTTKFECIGQSKAGSDTSIKNIPDSIQIRSKSVTNLSERSNSNILSQNQIKTVINNKQLNESRKNEILRCKNSLENSKRNIEKSKYNSMDHENNEYPNSPVTNRNNYDFDKNQNFISITENLYIGNVSVIKNERRMCRLNIEYLIDMTNMRPDDLNRQTLGKLPCLCKLQHSRLYLTVELVDSNYKTLFNSYAEINKYIEKARKTNKKVLIFAKDIFQQHLITALAQYLMLDYEMNLDNALNTISKRINDSSVYVGKSFLDYLKNFESYLQHLSINLYGTNDKNVVCEKSLSSMSKLNLKGSRNEAKDLKKFEKFNNFGDDDDDDDEGDDYDDEDDDSDVKSSVRSRKQTQTRFTVLPGKYTIYT